jgi:hypothetical protein
MSGAKPRYFARKVARDPRDQRIASWILPRKTGRVYLRIGAQVERN